VIEAVAKKRLLKTLQIDEDLALAAVICEVWRSAMALQLRAVPSGVNKSNIQSTPRL
jgi:hypothetical protein